MDAGEALRRFGARRCWQRPGQTVGLVSHQPGPVLPNLSDARISARVAAGCTQCGASASGWHIGSLRFGSTGPGW